MKTYGDYLSGIFPGIKVQKLSVDAGFTCPNRDGTISRGGCSYCRNDSFSPGYCNSSDSIHQQLENGKRFFGRKYPEMKYLAYFQRYTGTYGHSPEELEKFYMEALSTDDIIGLVIGTRPDALPSSTIDLLAKINQKAPVLMEIGAESLHDTTLKLINRNHEWKDVEEAVRNLSSKGIRSGLHLIAGLPGETSEMVLQTVSKACTLPIDTLKLHQLQILKDTPLSRQWLTGEIKVKEYSLQEYLELCKEIVKIVPKNIVIERFLSQSPPEMVLSPKWGLKNYEFMAKLAQLLEEKQQ